MGALIVLATVTLTLLVVCWLSFSSRAVELWIVSQGRSVHAESCERLAVALGQIRRTFLNPGSLAFLTANAPAAVMSSFETQQQRLARFSLHIASGTLAGYLTHKSPCGSVGSISSFLRVSHYKLRCASLLTICALGHAGLEIVRTIKCCLPIRLQVWTSAQILASIGGLLATSGLDETADDSNLDEDSETPAALMGTSNEETEEGAVLHGVQDALATALPNDLSRMIYIATLRDNNSGDYYHPELARKLGAQVANRAMFICHKELYDRVVGLSLEKLTDQLEVYANTTRVPKERLFESWRKLRAYRATIPIDALPISVEIFSMKVEVAVAVLEARLPF